MTRPRGASARKGSPASFPGSFRWLVPVAGGELGLVRDRVAGPGADLGEALVFGRLLRAFFDVQVRPSLK
nr:hypothetical protein [Candidatus Sigynarchaeum springense]